MGKKAAKSTRKFAASGQLKKTIEARRKHQQIKKKVQGRKAKSNETTKGVEGKGKGKLRGEDEESGLEEDDENERSLKPKSVDDLLGAGFMDASEDEDEDQDVESHEEDEEDGEDEDESIADDESFADIDDLEDEGTAHILELRQLAEKDPEFYKYLQENDKELLEFEDNAMGDEDVDEDGEDVEMEEDRVAKAPVLTKEELGKWQRALLDHRSLRALRKLLLAFRSAAHMNEEDQVLAWTIDSSSVYNKLVTTALKYTPVILAHHVPYKTLPNGKFKAPTQSPKQRSLEKMLISYLNNVIHLIAQLTQPEMVRMVITESAKVLPYVISSRRTVKAYLKTCLELWSRAEDETRMAAFLAIRKLATATDESILDQVLKGTYLTLVRSSKSTSAHTLPAINLMKNSASEIYCLEFAQTAAYQHAFGYIRQLAILLRNGMKVKSKESYKQVYNWQYVHCIDFWCLVLARACDTESKLERGGADSELKPLIYPLIQVTLGAIKLISASRSYPFHLHLLRSLVHLIRHTKVYVPFAPYLLPIITTSLSPSNHKKASTLRPLDFETQIRAPQQYLKTRVYAEGLAEEATHILAEWVATRPVVASIAFPEVSVPIVVALRKALKAARISGGGKGGGTGKEAGIVKSLVERLEESAKWVEQKRKGVEFGPGKIGEVESWEEGVKVEETPIGKYVKVQRKAREKRRNLIEKAREGKKEILED